MVTREELEAGVKGTIKQHIEYDTVSIAVGYDSQNGQDIPIAYIYNIPQNVTEKTYLQVCASENGGTKPQVAEPTTDEYTVGFECADASFEKLVEICNQTIKDIGLSPNNTDSELETEMKDTMTINPANVSEDNDGNAVIDLEDEF